MKMLREGEIMIAQFSKRNRSTHGLKTRVTLLLVLLLISPAFGSGGQYVKFDYPASSNPRELQPPVPYAFWIPDNVQTFRGIIVHQHGAGTTASIEGSTAAYDLQWQALARKWDCVLLGPSYHVTNEKIDLTP